MARRIRLDAPGTVHHVMIRGLEGGRIFLDVGDHQDFVDRLTRLLPECGARCFAWVLMTNHAHLVLQTDEGSLSRVMRRLNTGYAVRFNRLRERRGYLFMDRFRSRIVESDADLVNLIRYVHQNPIEAGLVGSLDALAAFPWSGHGALVGARAALPFEAVDAALTLFDEDPARARAELLAWMARDEGLVASGESPSPPADAPAPAPAPRVRCEVRGGLDELVDAACARYGLEPHELASGLKKPHIARARSAVAYVAVIELGILGRRVAAALGVSRAAVSAALDRGRRAAIEDGFSAVPGSTRPRGRI